MKFYTSIIFSSSQCFIQVIDLLTVIALGVTTIHASEITKVSSELDRHGFGLGIHRNIHTIYEMTCQESCCGESYCDGLLIEHINDALHIDKFELSRKRDYKALLDDKRRDAVHSTNDTFTHRWHLYIFSKVKCLYGKLTMDLTIPMHLENQKSNSGGKPVYIELPNPTILVRCPNKNFGYSVMKAPCSHRNKSECKWNNVKYESEKHALVFIIPTGNLLHVWFILGFTVIFAISGCVYITYKISMKGLPVMTRHKLN